MQLSLLIPKSQSQYAVNQTELPSKLMVIILIVAYCINLLCEFEGQLFEMWRHSMHS